MNQFIDIQGDNSRCFFQLITENPPTRNNSEIIREAKEYAQCCQHLSQGNTGAPEISLVDQARALFYRLFNVIKGVIGDVTAHVRHTAEAIVEMWEALLEWRKLVLVSTVLAGLMAGVCRFGGTLYFPIIKAGPFGLFLTIYRGLPGLEYQFITNNP
jgi:hypothetical protein